MNTKPLFATLALAAALASPAFAQDGMKTKSDADKTKTVADGMTTPSVRVCGDIVDFVSRFCGRVDPETGAAIGHLDVEGDSELGRRLLEKLPLPM